MDLLLLGLIALPLTIVCMVGAPVYVLVPVVARRWRRHQVRQDVEVALAEVPPAEPARRRHNAHCPVCGRFARAIPTSIEGVWTVCRVHGDQLRTANLIGLSAIVEVPVSTNMIPDTSLLEIPAVTSPLVLAAPLRAPLGLPPPEPRLAIEAPVPAPAGAPR